MPMTAALLIASALALHADSIQCPVADTCTTYNINFTLTQGNTAPTYGQFIYDSTDQTFYDFTVIWDGATFDLTGGANNPDVENGTACTNATGAALMLAVMVHQCTNYAPNDYYGWQVENGPNFQDFFVRGVEAVSGNGSPPLTGTSAEAFRGGIAPNDSGIGTFTTTAETSNSTPEPNALPLLLFLATVAIFLRKRIAHGLRQSPRLDCEPPSDY
jgi:hypothetical protein